MEKSVVTHVDAFSMTAGICVMGCLSTLSMMAMMSSRWCDVRVKSPSAKARLRA